ncbi:MAG: hypothetical protein DDT26_01016 [Dehalococcoidia bacterium]|nr:hypothetical protein [Chloroflexota bacterium]
MYLPEQLPSACVLITVKAYPLPSGKYTELVCTAGLLNGEKWIRIYPIPWTFLSDDKKYPKYSWIELDLVRNTSDFRLESYRPLNGIDEVISVTGQLGTADNWATRQQYVLQEVYTSMDELIHQARSNEPKSLATLKPLRIVDFVIEDKEREWKAKWLAQAKQGNLFQLDAKGQGKPRRLGPPLPYRYSYRFLTEGDTNPRKLMIEDWEIGALFWKCFRRTDGDEKAANELVRRKYLDEFVQTKDIYFFLGTTLAKHHISRNPFVIIGVFYPPKTSQLSWF